MQSICRPILPAARNYGSAARRGNAEHGPANRLIWAVAVMSWMFGLATAPFVCGDLNGLAANCICRNWFGWPVWPVVDRAGQVATGVVLLESRVRAGAAE